MASVVDTGSRYRTANYKVTVPAGVTWLKVLGCALFIVGLWGLQGHVAVLEYDRQQILAGEFWRIWTGHLVHTNSYHFGFNAAAMALLYLSFGLSMKPSELVSASVIFAPLISAVLWWCYPALAWYNGLSGLLHALVTYGCLRSIKAGDRYSLALLLVIWLKVMTEFVQSLLGYDSMQGTMQVITQAHLAGVAIGTAAALVSRRPAVKWTVARMWGLYRSSSWVTSHRSVTAVL